MKIRISVLIVSIFLVWNLREVRAGEDVAAKLTPQAIQARIQEHRMGDLNNEQIFGDFYRRGLGAGIIKEMAESAKRGNPNAVLYLNEQGALAGGNADKYVKLIRQTLDAGVPIEGLGCQGHFGGMFDPEHVQRTLDRLGRFNLPIKITEYDLNSSDEQLKAKHLRTFYEICFAHPAVEGIMMWGFWEGAHWRPKAALWKRDWSETPAARAYLDLVFNQWWTRQQGKANPEGIYKTRAFYGKYRITINGKEKEMSLSKNRGR